MFRFSNSRFKTPTTSSFRQTRALSDYRHIPRSTPKELVFFLSTMRQVQILDVRPRSEYNKIRVSGSLSFPVEPAFEQRATNLDKEVPVYVYCDKTSHPEPDPGAPATESLRAAAILKKMGFEEVFVVDGSVDELRKAGFFYHEPGDSKKRIDPVDPKISY